MKRRPKKVNYWFERAGTGRTSGTKLRPVLLDGPECEKERAFRKQTLNGPKRLREADGEERPAGVMRDTWSWR